METGAKHVGVPGFVAGGAVATLPLLGNPCEEPSQTVHEILEFIGHQNIVEYFAAVQHRLLLPAEKTQLPFVRALAHLEIEIIKNMDRMGSVLLHIRIGQVTGLEQEGTDVDVLDIEIGYQVFVSYPIFQFNRPTLRSAIFGTGRGRAVLEPEGFEPALPEQKQQVEGVVEILVTESVVAVVPFPYLVPVQSWHFRREFRIQISVGKTLMVAKTGSRLIVQVFSPEKWLTRKNMLTPVTKTKRTSRALSLMMP